MLAADYPFLDVLWTMVVFFVWVLWFWLLFLVIADIFRRRDLSGWGKAGWLLFNIILPYIGVFVYLITQSKHMAERNQREAQAAQTQFDQYVQSVAAQTDPAAQIEKAKQLLDSGAITQAEFDDLKRKALAA
jgi:putative oligomerization/nucleic acid binding protein